MEQFNQNILICLLLNIIESNREKLAEYLAVSPQTIYRCIEEERPRFPSSITLEQVKKTFLRREAGTCVRDLLECLEKDLEMPRARADLENFYNTKKSELGENEACSIIIEELYYKCKRKYTYSGETHNYVQASLEVKNEDNNDSSVNKENDIKSIAKSGFLSVLKNLDYLNRSENTTESLSINSKWLPGVKYEDTEYDNLTKLIIDMCSSGNFVNGVIFAEPGSGKTYSIFDAVKKLLTDEISYDGKLIVPVYISSLLLTINDIGLIKGIADAFCNGDLNLTREAFKDDSKLHFLLFVDAINEHTDDNALMEEIIKLSHSLYKNVSLIVSSNDNEEIRILQDSGFAEITMSSLEMGIIDSEVEDDTLSDEFKKLLLKPFYLERYLSLRESNEVNDEYSVIDAYVQSCKTNGKIVDVRGQRKWSKLLDEQLTEISFRCTINRQMYFSTCRNSGEERDSFTIDEYDIKRLVQIGILKKYSNTLYFEHENYRNYFASKYVLMKCMELCDNSNAPRELQLKLLGENIKLIKDTPANVCSILAPKLYNDGLLQQLIVKFSGLNNDPDFAKIMIGFYQAVIGFFALCTTTLDGLDLSNANLWMVDFTRFNKIINCDFSATNLNPETIWLHHAKISYSDKNSGKIKNNLIFLSGAEGFEVYNWKDDRQVFLRFPQKAVLKFWDLTENALYIAFENKVYYVGFEEIVKKLHSNTDLESVEMLLSDAYIAKKANIENIRFEGSVKLNARKDELRYSSGKELYFKPAGKSALSRLVENCYFATFIDDDTVFADCDGVYIIVNVEGKLIWKRMIKPIMPQIIRREKDGVVVEMILPGVFKTKIFKYTFSDWKASFLDCKEKEKSADLGNIFTRDYNKEFGMIGDSIVIKDESNNEHCIYGGAIEFTNTRFNGATIVQRPIDDKERKLLEQFGGIVNL